MKSSVNVCKSYSVNVSWETNNMKIKVKKQERRNTVIQILWGSCANKKVSRYLHYLLDENVKEVNKTKTDTNINIFQY